MRKRFYSKLARKSSLYAAILLLFIVGCSSNKVDEDKLVTIFVRNLIIEETYSTKLDSMKLMKKQLFVSFKTSQEEFEKELTELGTDKVKWEKFYNKANKLLEDLRKSGAVK